MVLQKYLNFTQEELKSQYYDAMTTWFVNVLIYNTLAFVYSGQTWCWWKVLILQPCRGKCFVYSGNTYCVHSYFITLPPLHTARPSCLPCLEETLGKEEETWECPAGEAGGVLLRFPLESKSPTDFILATVSECSLEAGPASSLEPKHRELCPEQGRKKSVSRNCIRACVCETRKPNPLAAWSAAEAWQANWRDTCVSHV